jgi:hypothetical protein
MTLLLSFLGGIATVYLFLKIVLHIDDLTVVRQNPLFLTRLTLAFYVAVLIFLIPLASLSLTSERARAFLLYPKIYSVWLWVTVFSYGIGLSQLLLIIRRDPILLSSAKVSTACGVAGGLGFVGGFIMAAYLNEIRRNMFRRRVYTYYPEAIITNQLLLALVHIEKSPNHWARSAFKHDLNAHIDAVAICMERHLPRRLRINNAAMDAWLEETSAQMAAGTRNLIKWLFTPKQDTFEQFKNRITSYFIFAARGDWDSFEKTHPEKLSRHELWQSKVRHSIAALVSAAVPVLVLWLVKRMGIVTEPILTYLTVGAYIWAALTLLSHLDPNYGAKLTALKDITQLIPFSKKERE